MLPFNMGAGGASGVDTDDIGHSLRLRSAASAYLSRTITTDTTSTYFAAVKRGKLGVITPIFDTNIKFNANDTLTAFGLTTTAVFRDPTAWLFIHVSNGGLYVNGVSYGAVTTSAITNPRIGYDGTNYADMYIARIGVVGGSSSSCTNFGYQNTEINEWVTKSQSTVKAVVDAGGTNSFMLDFDDGTSLTTLGYDKSSKGNNWTLNNVSLTAGTSYDHMLDVPGNSFCTLNPINNYLATLSDGNLKCVVGADSYVGVGTQAVSSGQWYWEVEAISAIDMIGVSNVLGAVSTYSWKGANGWFYYANNGAKYTANGSVAYGAGYVAGDIIGVALDMDAYTVTFYKNNVSQGVAYSVFSGKLMAPSIGGAAGASGGYLNCGQAPLHASATYHSAAGGYFRYAPPSGYKALCQRNMPTPAILNPKKHFDVKTQLGSAVNTGANLLAQFTDFTADLAWGKDRAAVNNHQLVDTVRGSTAVRQSNTPAAETTYTAPTSGDNCVAWGWKAGGAAVSDTAGSISSQVSANVEAGFSIVTYTGNLTAGATVGHGLGKVPKMVVWKSRNGATNWPVIHISGGSPAQNGGLYLNLTNAWAADSGMINNTWPNSSAVTLGSSVYTNNGSGMVMLCFAEIEGFSKTFSYTGNGSTDGPFVHCGFKPKFVLIKYSSGVGDWCIFDGVRDIDNAVDSFLYPNLSTAEQLSPQADFTSTGFKPRGTEANVNQNGATYIGIAFADVPGKYALGR